MKIELTVKDLQTYQSIARKEYVEAPNCLTLPHGHRPLVDAELASICQIRAAVVLLVKHGVLPPDTEVPVFTTLS